MPDPTFAQIWELLRGELEARHRELVAQYESSFAGLTAVLRGQCARVREQAAPELAAGAIPSIVSLVRESGERLLFEPVRLLRKARPQEKALDALESHGAALDDLVRRLPPTVVATGAELVDVLGPHLDSRLRAYRLRRRDYVEVPLRRVVETHLAAEAEDRAVLDGSCLLLLAQSTLLLLAPWQDLRQQALLRLAGQPADERAWERARDRWLRQAEAMAANLDQRLPALRAWEEGAAQRVAQAIPRAPRGRNGKLRLRRQWNFHYWSRQQRAVSSVADLEWELAEMLAEAARTAAEAVAALDAEQAALLAELDAAVIWLEAAQGGEVEGDFPPPAAQLVSAEDRMGAWEEALRRTARERLPLEVETVDPQRALPGRREPWRRLEPQQEFVEVVARRGRPVVMDGLREVEGAHRAVVRTIERAREVVHFSLETAQAEAEEGAAVAREGLANALALLAYQKQSTTDPHERAESKLVQGIAGSFVLLHLSLEQHRLGLLTQLVRQSGARAAQEFWKVARQRTASAGEWLQLNLRAQYHWLLRKAGWEAAPAAVHTPVAARGYVGEVLNLHLGARDLPAIYRRLFRLAPVEEPRFLVGREAEMAALAHARSLWQAGHSVAAVLVGDRGSGKTSLLNCAVAREFTGVEVIRSQFSARIEDAAGMQAFLRGLLRIPDGQSVTQGLLEGKRVVVLEELERTFLRRMNGFAGLEELLAVVSGTSRTTLWILSVNQNSYRYLDAAVGLGQYFSHRINAMSIPPQQLKNAILLRHNLSGLRLQFPAVPRTGGRLQGLQQLLGLQPGPEERFFDVIYRQSEGIFRSAFELWQHFMERVEGGVLYMRPPAEPDFEPLIAQFTQADSFTLQAILQHGSLAEQEHAEVFECSARQSRVQMEKLVHLECLEPDPAGPGLRIRPEAGRLVRMALHRQNLI